MNDPREHPDIAAAIELLETAERLLPSERSADAFSEAFVLLDDTIDAGLDGHSVGFIDNLKYAYTRILLTRLRDISSADAAAWYHYLVLLLITLRPQCERLRQHHPDLGLLFDQCVKNHAAQLKELLDG